MGEFGIDWEVKESPLTDGGVGVFALRPIQKDEIIMLERSILTLPTLVAPGAGFSLVPGDIPIEARAAVTKLHPASGTLVDKFKLNGMSTTDDDTDDGGKTGLFIRMSRVNHHCIGNSTHRFLENRNVKILVASRTIDPGEEITFSYVSNLSTGRAMNKLKLELNYGFTCRCEACVNSEVEDDLVRMKELDNDILTSAGMGMVEVAMRKGKALIKLYDKYGIDSWQYHRTYYDLFQSAITKRKSLNDGKKYIVKSYEAALAFTSDPQNESVRRMKEYADAPSSHRNHLLLD